MNVLVTCGPTWVAIDGVRVISNASSGEMGHLIAQEFLRFGAKVTLVEGPVTHAWSNPRVKVIKYRFFDELAKVLKAQLRHKYDVIVHAAAVSDFKVAGASQAKIASGKPLTLRLVPTPKLIQMVKRLCPQALLVGFKLEASLRASFKETKELFVKAGCDVVVANTFGKNYQAAILNADGEILSKANSKKQLARNLVSIVL